jgi:hypothetical protein
MGGAHPNIRGDPSALNVTLARSRDSHPLANRDWPTQCDLNQQSDQRMALGGRADFSCRPEAASGKRDFADPGK